MRRSVRLAIPAIAAASVLLLGACGSDSDSGDGGIGGNPLGQDSDSSEEGGSGGGSTSVADAEGTWATDMTTSPFYVVSVQQGQFVMADDTGQYTCTGMASDDGGLLGDCSDGSQLTGSATVDGDTMNVSLDSGDEYVFQRIPEGQMPDMGEIPGGAGMADMGSMGGTDY